MNVVDEFATSFRESIYYLREEVDFCLHYFSKFSTSTDQIPFRTRAKILQELLNSIDRGVELFTSKTLTPDSIYECGRLHSIRSTAPRPLFEISQAVSNRQHFKGMPDASHNFSRLMKSVHPYYASSYIGIEAFSRFCHDTAASFFPDFIRPDCPLVDVWASEQYAWDPTVGYDVPQGPFQKYSTPAVLLDRHTHYKNIRRLLNLTTLRVPRWACYQLRLCGSFLPHEYFHRMMGVINRFCVQDGKYYARRPLARVLLRVHLDLIYGKNIRRLYALRNSAADVLAQDVYSTLADLNVLSQKHSSTLTSVVEELLADAFAYYIVGPPFASSLACELLPLLVQSYTSPSQIRKALKCSDPSDHFDRLRQFYLEFDYPHPFIRLLASIRVMELMPRHGEYRALATFLQPVQSMLDRSFDSPSPWPEFGNLLDVNGFFSRYIEFVYSEDFRNLVVDFFQLLGNSGVKNFTGGLGCPSHDEELRTARLERFHSLLCGCPWEYDKLHSGEFGLTDLVGVIWRAKRGDHDNGQGAYCGSGQQSAWRVFLWDSASMKK